MLNEWKYSQYTEDGAPGITEAQRDGLIERFRSIHTIDRWKTASSGSFHAIGNYAAVGYRPLRIRANENQGCCGGCVIL